MNKNTVKKIFSIMDNPKLTNEEKTKHILQIFAKQKYVDIPFLKGILRELGQTELLNKLEKKLEGLK